MNAYYTSTSNTYINVNKIGLTKNHKTYNKNRKNSGCNCDYWDSEGFCLLGSTKKCKLNEEYEKGNIL